VITAWIGLLVGLAVMSQAAKASYDNSLTLAGWANWWLPRWLDRRLQYLAIEPPAKEQPVRAPRSALV
jgi:hypothetical protein